MGDFVVFNDEAADANHVGRRSYECAQIVGPGSTGDVVHTGGFQFQRAYPGVDAGWATFGTLICSHLAGTKFYKLDSNAHPTDAISADEWDANVPENMAPVLGDFARGALGSRRSPSPIGTAL